MLRVSGVAWRPNLMRLLVLVWFLFIASGSLWLPAYKADSVEGKTLLIPIYAFVAFLAAIGVRGRSRSVGHALLSALPVLALLAAAAVAGDLRNEHLAQFRGEPLRLYYGVALWASWAVLVLLTAIVSRTRWSGFVGVGLGVLVAVLGFNLFASRID